jgi:FG-GAP repeat
VPVGTSPVDVAVADFDGDGNDDLAVANSEGSVSVRPGSGPAPLAGNLLVNGGFEGSTPSGKIRPPLTITGWELQGGISYARYGGASLASVPGRIASPRYNGGGRMLAGGDSSATAGVTGVSQLVDVSADAQAIDAGRATANLSAYLGGALQYEDAFTAKAEFVNGNAALGSFQIGPVTATDRNLQTTLIRRAGSSPVPAGTRQIRVTLTSTDADKQQSSALADNAKLTLTVAPAPTQTGNDTPQPTTTPKGFGAQTLVTLKAARRLKAGKPVKVVVRNANEFAVSGKLGSKRLTVGARSSTTVKVKLSARQRRALERKHSLKVRLTAEVNDPAGVTRRVSRTVRLRSR